MTLLQVLPRPTPPAALWLVRGLNDAHCLGCLGPGHARLGLALDARAGGMLPRVWGTLGQLDHFGGGGHAMRPAWPLPNDEKIYHVAHDIYEQDLPLSDGLWARYGLDGRPALQRAVTVAVLRLREVSHG